MIGCKTCGAALRFDIPSQRMKCSYCDNSFDPYEFDEDKGAYEGQEFEVTVFSCTMCGGRLTATENSAAEFCSYCGAPTILQGRMSHMERPKYIIPFRKTKEECQTELKKHLKKSFFVPEKFKNFEVEKIRGIYMPTWNYNVVQQSEKAFVNMNVDSETDKDAYDIYNLTAKVDARYNGISHDASASFSDNISEVIEPFNYKERKKFSPSFISGFYADMKDVNSDRYMDEAVKIANEQTYKRFIDKVDDKKGSISARDNRGQSEIFNTHVESVDSTMIPVWFMAYRLNKRVAYATINGESGKVVSDLPISIIKILLAVLVLAIPIFAVLNVFVSMRATTLMNFVTALMTFTGLLYCFLLNEIKKKQQNTNFISVKRKSNKSEAKANLIGMLVLSGAGIILLIVLTHVFGEFFYLISLGAVIVPAVGLSRFKKKDLNMQPHGFIILLAMGLECVRITYVNPIADVEYYKSAIGALLAILFALINIINALNMFTTRPLPQFGERGGEQYE